MKIKNFLAIVIAVAAIIFIILQFKKTKEQKPFLLTGEWQVDSSYSIGATKDTTSLLLASIAGTEKPSFTFHEDSTLTDLTKPKDSAFQKYYLRDSVLFIDEGIGFRPYKILQMSEGNLSFITQDSVVFLLKKK